MKIAIVSPTYLPSRRANTFQVMKMAQAWCELGHTIAVLVPGSDPELNHPEWEELAIHYGLHCEFPVLLLPARPRFRRYDYGLHALFWARRWGAELFYSRLPQAAALGSLMGMRTVFEVHDYPQGRLGPVLLSLFLKGSGAARLVAITRALARAISVDYAAPEGQPFTLVAPDGVDLERYKDQSDSRQARSVLRDWRPDLNLQVDQFMAGYTGHLYPGRGIGLILDLADALPDIRFLLAGGEEQDIAQLQNKVKSRGLKNVILAGFVPNAEIPRYQMACDVMLMPYQRRVAASSGGDIAPYLSPMKLFEYLACGRPILSSDLPVLREVLNKDNAILLPLDDLPSWVDTLQALRADPGKRSELGVSARRCAQEYTWQARAMRIIAGLDHHEI